MAPRSILLSPSTSRQPTTETEELQERGPVGLRTLNDPQDPYLELIFVHGFMGDSLSTWTFENDKATYWPRWFVEEEFFANTRIHTYGYHEPPINGKAPVSKLRDIGISLSSALEVNTYVKSDAQNPIICIAHSLGGLVVKAAIKNAKLKDQDLGNRFHTVLFLATPHRDVQNRDMLKSILRECDTQTARTYTLEPDANTAVLQEINDDFMSISSGLRIYSFFEINHEPVVEKRRATLSLQQEKEVRVNADHAGVARFRSSADPTYIAINQILRSIVTDIKEEFENPERVRSQLASTAKYLALNSTEPEEEEEFIRREQARVDGSCEWLLDKPNFKHWRDRGLKPSTPPKIYWLSGDPGCGKSFLAAHVTTHLRDRGLDTSCYFLKHGDLARQGSGGLLKSIVHQMASRSASLRRSLDQMRRDDTLTADHNDIRGIWKQLFVQRVFQASVLERHQYWVIDALDEASSGLELLNLLKVLPQGFSVFITCRRDRHLERELRPNDDNVVMHKIEREDTLQDIRTYLEHSQDDLHVDDELELQDLIQELVDRSRGSFLWTRLIVQELSHWWTDDDIKRVLKDVPPGMSFMYKSMVTKIMEKPNYDLARIILRWVICATRPLAVTEVRAVVKMNTTKTLKNPAKAIEDICGPLVTISNDRVQVVHDTVRDYLFSKDQQSESDVTRDFLFDKGYSHEKLAIDCISFLCATLRAPQLQASLRSNAGTKDDVFLDYASTNFSDHMAKSYTAEDTLQTDSLLQSLREFFRGPVLSWIHRLAKAQSLSILITVGKNLKSFATRRSNVLGMANLYLQEIQEWADDLIHLVTVFGRDLIKDPAAIHTVIPRLCPTLTRVYREFGNLEIGLQIHGLPRRSWPDRISSASFGQLYSYALATSEKYHAVSLAPEPQIVLYHATTCQETRRITTSENIQRLQFAHNRDWLVASGRRTLSLFNFESGEQIWTKNIDREILALMITNNDSDIVGITREKTVETFNTRTGTPWDRPQRLQHTRVPGRHPQQAHFCEELGLLALIHRNEELEIYCWPGLLPPRGRIPCSSCIDAIAFNPALKRIAIASFDGELCTVDLSTMKKLVVTDGNASHLAVSADGNTLIAGMKCGDIQIFEFETLNIMHKIRYYEEEFMALCFASNGLRLLDIRRQSFNVWEPAVLVRRKDEEESSRGEAQSTTFSTAPSQLIEAVDALEKTPISAIVEHHTGEFVICGRENGSVFVHETMKGKAKCKLFDFGRTEVSFLAWNQRYNLLASAEKSGTVKLHKVNAIQEPQPGGGISLSWRAEESMPKKTLSSPIRQILLSLDGNLLLVSTTTKEHAFNTNSGERLFEHDCASPLEQRSQKWATFSSTRRQLYEVQRGHSHRVFWDNTETLAPKIQDIQLHDPIHGEAEILHSTSHFVRISDQLWGAYDNNRFSPPVIWQQQTQSEPVSLVDHTSGAQSLLADFAAKISNILGIFRSRLVYLSTDNWICSVRVDQMPHLGQATLHFPVPHYWRSASRRFFAHVTVKGDIVIAVDGDLAVVKHGLMSENGELHSSSSY